MSRRMDESMVGSHVQRGAHGRRADGERMPSYASARTSARARNAHVEGVAPQTSSLESNASYRQRSRQRGYVEGARRKSLTRRAITIIVAAIVVVGVAAGAGFLAFRGSVGSEMSLKNSDAPDALVAVRSDEPYYALVTAELGAVAEPLAKAGPDIVLLAYVDRQAEKLSLVNIPSSLQVSVDNAQRRLGDVAEMGDAAFIRAVQNFAKVDISHYVKIGKGGVDGMVDALGGIEVTFDQVIDDPHAGDVYLPLGTYTLNGAGALTYLRADNLAMGVEDQLKNQLNFASLLLARVFSPEGAFVQRIEAIDAYFQTDYSLADLEVMNGWLSGIAATDVVCTPLPGYMTSTAGVVDLGESRFVCSSDDMAKIIESLEGGQVPTTSEDDGIELVNPASFTVEVQNGTSITGAASTTADLLKSKGFLVEKTGNAEQQVYTETLVVYKANDKQGAVKPGEAAAEAETTYVYDENGEVVDEVTEVKEVKAMGGNDNGVGLARAKTVIDGLGVGRAVEAGAYYSFGTDVLVIIGSDYKPVS